MSGEQAGRQQLCNGLSNLHPIIQILVLRMSLLQGSIRRQTVTETGCALEPNGCSSSQFEIYSVSTRQLDVPAGGRPLPAASLPKSEPTRPRLSLRRINRHTDPNHGVAQAQHRRAAPRAGPDRTRGERPPATRMSSSLPTGSSRNQHTSAGATNPIQSARPRLRM